MCGQYGRKPTVKAHDTTELRTLARLGLERSKLLLARTQVLKSRKLRQRW